MGGGVTADNQYDFKNPEIYCQTDLYRNFRLSGFLLPEIKSDKIMECQHMTYNCCTETDFAKLMEYWDDYYSKYIEFNHFYFTFYIRELIRYHHVYVEKATFIADQNEYPVCRKSAQLIKNFEFPEDFDEHLDALFKKVYDFDMALKKGFACFMCDFENAKHIDLETKSVFFNINVCDSIVTHTFEFNQFFNRYIYKYVNTVAMLSHCINTHDILEKREQEAEEQVEHEEEEIEMMEHEEERQTKRLAKELVEGGKRRVLEAAGGAQFDQKMPKDFKSAGEKLKVEEKTIQQKLMEQKELDQELEKEKQELEGGADEEEEMSPQELKTQEELEIEIIEGLKEAGDEANTFNMTDPDVPNSFDFIEIDNDIQNNDCLQALQSKKIKRIRERCVNYCHRYSMWFYSGSIYRNIDKLKAIFEFVKKFLIDDLEYDAEAIPEKVDLNEHDLFPVKDQTLNVFESFNFYFGADGILKDSLFEWET